MYLHKAYTKHLLLLNICLLYLYSEWPISFASKCFMSSVQENQEGVLAKPTCNWEIIKSELMGVDWIQSDSGQGSVS
jgi:hypothetical protein